MLGDLHLVSPETEKVGQLVSVIKRLRGMAVSEIGWESFAMAATVYLLWLLLTLLLESEASGACQSLISHDLNFFSFSGNLGRFDLVSMKTQERGHQEPLVLTSLNLETFVCKARPVLCLAKS